MELLSSSVLHLQLLPQCLYGLFEILNEAEVVGVVRLCWPSSHLDGPTISGIVGFTAVRLGFGSSADLGVGLGSTTDA